MWHLLLAEKKTFQFDSYRVRYKIRWVLDFQSIAVAVVFIPLGGKLNATKTPRTVDFSRKHLSYS